jgi:hypothetical protein
MQRHDSARNKSASVLGTKEGQRRAVARPSAEREQRRKQEVKRIADKARKRDAIERGKTILLENISKPKIVEWGTRDDWNKDRNSWKRR